MSASSAAVYACCRQTDVHGCGGTGLATGDSAAGTAHPSPSLASCAATSFAFASAAAPSALLIRAASSATRGRRASLPVLSHFGCGFCFHAASSSADSLPNAASLASRACARLPCSVSRSCAAWAIFAAAASFSLACAPRTAADSEPALTSLNAPTLSFIAVYAASSCRTFALAVTKRCLCVSASCSAGSTARASSSDSPAKTAHDDGPSLAVSLSSDALRATICASIASTTARRTPSSCSASWHRPRSRLAVPDAASAAACSLSRPGSAAITACRQRDAAARPMPLQSLPLSRSCTPIPALSALLCCCPAATIDVSSSTAAATAESTASPPPCTHSSSQ